MEINYSKCIYNNNLGYFILEDENYWFYVILMQYNSSSRILTSFRAYAVPEGNVIIAVSKWLEPYFIEQYSLQIIDIREMRSSLHKVCPHFFPIKMRMCKLFGNKQMPLVIISLVLWNDILMMPCHSDVFLPHPGE